MQNVTVSTASPAAGLPLRVALARPTSEPVRRLTPRGAQQVTQRTKRRRLLWGRISQTDRIFFIDNLATMMQAGLSLSLALETLIPESRTKQMKRCLRDIKLSVDSGSKFSESLKRFPELFAPLYIAVVEVGEAGGTLSEVLTKLAETTKKAKALRSKIISALLYPTIVVTAMIVIVVILMLYVFPQLIAIFEEVHAELPLQTRILIRIVTILQTKGLFIAGGVVVLAIIFFMGGRFRSVRRLYHRIWLRMLFVGPLWREVVLIRLCGNLKMLLESGVPIVQGLTIAARTAGNIVYEDAMREVASEVEIGKSLHDVFQKRPRLFPSLVVSMARVGEGTGKFDEILGKLEAFYQARVEAVFANLSTIIEPALLLTVGAAVGFIAVSVIMPIYNLAQAF